MEKTKVLVVDDSALVRGILKEGLSKDPEIEVVATAQDAFIARDKILQFRPDVMTLDVEMPRMDGVEFLRKLMPQWPIPTIVVSSLTGKGKQISLEALEAGAVEIVTKPASDIGRSLPDMLGELINMVKLARHANIKVKRPKPAIAKHGVQKVSTRVLAESTDKVIAIGASTGGTEALKEVLRSFNVDTPGIVVVQHMPPGFTKQFADTLNKICDMEVMEAKSGDRILHGRVLIAPGGYQMKVKRSGGIYEVICKGTEKVSGHCPSVDVLFQSVAEHVGANAVGCILTGMGKDGAEGMKAMFDKGAKNIAQNEESCVVYGMPKAAVENNAVHNILPLNEISNQIIQFINSKKII